MREFLSGQVSPSVGSAAVLLRWMLFLYLCLVLCPIRYWIPTNQDVQYIDNTWMFALNYAAYHHLVIGSDVIWTYGPLSYLLFPFDIGSNLAHGFEFQVVIWILVVVILSDLFFRSAFQVRNLALFSVLIGLSVVDYYEPVHPANLLLPLALILLVHFRLCGGIVRYIAALVIMGLVPLIQISGAFVAAGITAGLFVDRLLRDGRSAKIYAALTAMVPLTVAIAGLRLALGSFAAMEGYFRSGLELIRGYSVAMSWSGPRLELIVALEAVLLLAAAVLLLALRQRDRARFVALVLALPVALSVKHAFVRQEFFHIAQFFCFVAVALAVLMLAIPLNERVMTIGAAIVTLLFAVLWQDYVAMKHPDSKGAMASVAGIRALSLVWHAMHAKELHRSLELEARRNYPVDKRIEPELKSIVGGEPVGFLSYAYSTALMDDLNLVLLPVVQGYSAYTPYLDRLNATWIDNKGPRYLIFDGKAIDNRHPWTESPATWSEVYRWYDTRMLGERNLLLQRRVWPRFTRFESLVHRAARFGENVTMPVSPGGVFWTMQCSLSGIGKLKALLARVPAVMMDANEKNGETRSFRVLPPVLGAPSLGTYLPSNLAEFAKVFSDKRRDFSVAKLVFGGPGKAAYQQECQIEFLQPVQ